MAETYGELHYPGDVVADIALGKLLGCREDGRALVALQAWYDGDLERTVVVTRVATPAEVAAEAHLMPALLRGQSAAVARFMLEA